MKKIKISIIAVIAIVMGIVGSAFTTNHSSLVTYYFEFDITNNAPTLTNVTNPSLWHEVVSPTGCSNDDERACVIEVDESKTLKLMDQPRTLDPVIVINTKKFDTDVYYVLDQGDIENAFNNYQ